MSYFLVLPIELKEQLLHYFYLADVIYIVDNIESFSCLKDRSEEHFWKSLHQTFWSSQDISYQNTLRKLEHQRRINILSSTKERDDKIMYSTVLNELDNRLNKSTDEYIAIAAAYGNLHFVKLLHKKGHRITFDMMELAAMCGHYDLFEYCFENINCPQQLTYRPNLNHVLNMLMMYVMGQYKGTSVKIDRLRAARYLISKGADIDSLSEEQKQFLLTN